MRKRERERDIDHAFHVFEIVMVDHRYHIVKIECVFQSLKNKITFFSNNIIIQITIYLNDSNDFHTGREKENEIDRAKQKKSAAHEHWAYTQTVFFI